MEQERFETAKKEKPENKENVTIVLKPSIKEAAKEKAEKNYTSLSQVIEDKLTEYIK